MNEESTNKAIEDDEPSAESLQAMPEIASDRYRRRPGRGHHRQRRVGEIVAIDADVWSHFGSARAVNAALRRLVKSQDDARE